MHDVLAMKVMKLEPRSRLEGRELIEYRGRIVSELKSRSAVGKESGPRMSCGPRLLG